MTSVKAAVNVALSTLTTALDGTEDMTLDYEQAAAQALDSNTDMKALQYKDKLYAAGVKFAEGSNGVRYAIVNEGQLMSLMDIEQRGQTSNRRQPTAGPCT